MSAARMPYGLATWLLPLALLGCQRQAPHADAGHASGDYAAQEWILPSAPGAGQPDLVATGDGRLLLGWIDASAGRRNALQFAQWNNGHWQSAPRTIVVGDSLIANSANTPHLAATADGALWVQWLQGAPGAAGNDVMLSRSADGGFNWSPPVRINANSDGGEHGFASLWPAARDRIGVAWLDGAAPAQATAAKSPHAMPADDASALRAAVFDMGLRRSAAATLDARTCDCCRTAVAVDARGALLAYRGRAPGDIREIDTTRFNGSTWTPPSIVHADHWVMTACPVNGPALATDGGAAVVAWYTAANDTPAVELARSRDGGVRFDAPVVVDHGAAVQGRVAVALDAQQAWVLWVSGDGATQVLWLARYAPDLSRQLQRLRLAALHAGGPGAGYPQLVVQGDDAYVAWSDADAHGVQQLHGVVLSR